MIDSIPRYITCRLEIDERKDIIRLMKLNWLLYKIKWQGVRFCNIGIEILLKRIKTNQKENELLLLNQLH